MVIYLFWLYNTPVNFVNFYVLTPESPIFRGLYSLHFRVSFCQFCQFLCSDRLVFSFLWYDPFVGLMVFAIILYHKKKSLALPFRSVPGSFSLLGLQQPQYTTKLGSQ